MQRLVARQSLTVTRSGCWLQRSASSGQEFAIRPGRGRKWGSSLHGRMVRGLNDGYLERINADSVHPLGRHGQRGVDFWSQQPWSRYIGGVRPGSATSEPPTRALAPLESGDQCRMLITGLQSTRAARGGLSSPIHCRPCTLVCREVPTHREEWDLLNAWHLRNGATSAAC